MYIKQIVSTAGALLNKQNVVDYLEKNTLSGNALEQVNILTSLTNLVLSELAVSGFYIVKSEQVSATGGKIAYSILKERPSKIISLVDLEGNNCSFNATTEYVETQKAQVTITYAYAPYNEGLETQVLFEDYRVTPIVIAMGVCAEYLLTVNDFDGAVAWHDKYVDSLEKLKRVKNVTVKQRSFI